jgi:hypothetical protein
MNTNFIAACVAALALAGCGGASAAPATPAKALDSYLAKRGYTAATVSSCRARAGVYNCRVVYSPGTVAERECFTWRKAVVRVRAC